MDYLIKLLEHSMLATGCGVVPGAGSARGYFRISVFHRKYLVT
jgi:hypothetical protein